MSVSSMQEVLKYFALKYDGDFRKELRAIQQKEQVDDDLKDKLFADVRYDSVVVIDENYPDYFKEMNCPPMTLFYDGDIDLIDKAVKVEEFTLESQCRAFVAFAPEFKNGKIEMDYIIMAERHDDMEVMLDAIRDKAPKQLEKKEKPKNKKPER